MPLEASRIDRRAEGKGARDVMSNEPQTGRAV